MTLNRCIFCDKIIYTPIHVTEITNGKIEVYHVCKTCGVEYMKGVEKDLEPKKSQPPAGVDVTEIKTPFDLFQFITGAMKQQPPQPSIPKFPPCACGLTVEEFRKYGRFGCAKCYTHFEEEVQRFVYPYHNADTHIGKRPKSADPDENSFEEKKKLIRLRMAKAIELEDYETAATLKKELATLSELPSVSSGQ